MQLGQEQIVAQLDELLGMIEPKIAPGERGGGDWFRAADVEAREMRTRAVAAIVRLAPPGSPYKQQADEIEGYDGYIVARLAGILRALRADFAAGYTSCATPRRCASSTLRSTPP